MLEHGYIQIYTGDGKGKTTAAMGLALRALAAGRRIHIVQFLKSGTAGEAALLESMRDCGKIQNDMLTADNPQREKLMDDLCVFLSSSLGLRMRRAFGRGELYRETSFLLGIRADRIDPEWDREHIIQVQGRIDAWFLEGDKAFSLILART